MLAEGADGPVTAEAFAAAFAALESAKCLLLAVSGGPDSTALAILAARWSKAPNRPRIEVATVDHALRPQSGQEARAVDELCRQLGLKHHLLRWIGEKPKTRIQERARDARYALLRQCGLDIGAEAIVTAHHADDQAETVLFRLLRGSGIAGLRGMERCVDLAGVRLARPLLGMRKAALVATCHDAGRAFALDASNEDPRFARPRLRALLRAFAPEGLTTATLTRLARRAAQADDALARCAAASDARLAGAANASAFLAEPPEIVRRVLARRICEVAAIPPSAAPLEALEALALDLGRAAREARAHRANLAGVSVALDSVGRLAFAPEAPRRARKAPP